MKAFAIPDQSAMFITDFEDKPIHDQRTGLPIEVNFKSWLLQVIGLPAFTEGMPLIESIDFALGVKRKIDDAKRKITLENEEHRRLSEAIKNSGPDPRWAKCLRPWIKVVLEAETCAEALEKPKSEPRLAKNGTGRRLRS